MVVFRSHLVRRDQRLLSWLLRAIEAVGDVEGVVDEAEEVAEGDAQHLVPLRRLITTLK